MVDDKGNFGKLALKELTIQNFATFENQSFSFSSNFSAIVGETGSGKSLILDAIELLLGSRSNKKIVRKENDFAVVEGSFEVFDDSILNYFETIGYPCDSKQIVIKRIIYNNGRSKAYLNFQTCNIQTLLQFSRTFIDLVGQFENQKLLGDDYHLELLDNFCSVESKLNSYKNDFKNIQKLKSSLNELYDKRDNLEREKDYLIYQEKIFNKLSPSIKRENELIESKEKLMNSQSDIETQSIITDLLTNGENSITSNLSSTLRLLPNLSFSTESIFEQLNDINNQIEEISFNLSKEDIRDDPDLTLEEIIDELDQYSKLKRKFRCKDTEALLAEGQRIHNELSSIQNIDESIKSLENELDKLELKAMTKATEIGDIRLANLKKLGQKLTQFLQTLRMKGAKVEFRHQTLEELTINGIDRVELYAQTNPGEGFHRLKDIASGGELSRILLSIRNVIASNDSISIFLFDEIDTGIGGETALSIGKALAEVACKSQVIAITHLPQIASFSDSIINVYKKTIKKSGHSRTISLLEVLSGNHKKKVIEQMSPIVH